MNVLTIVFFMIFAVSVHAAPLESREVVSPPVLTPGAGTVWVVGSTETVTWNVSVIPSGDDPVGQLILGYNEDGSEHLMLDSPLASNITLKDGSVNITVPSVPERDNYIVCLFGDSGNISPNFTITGGGASSSASSSASTVAPASSTSSSSSASSSSTVAPSTTIATTLSSNDPTPTTIVTSVASSTTSIASTSLSATSSGSSASPAAAINAAHSSSGSINFVLLTVAAMIVPLIVVL
ncbi:hypothetical protein PLICRDRAFT_125544 [Plicaturopsis crispa FD-325 SS-3]|nr:hypothetical protein PLICRDRAFT_125544 [Plicaturopsis crispa FD-325 SS-3]